MRSSRKEKFPRITLLTDRLELRSQNFFKRHGFFEFSMLPMRLLISTDTPAEVTLRASARAFSAAGSLSMQGTIRLFKFSGIQVYQAFSWFIVAAISSPALNNYHSPIFAVLNTWRSLASFSSTNLAMPPRVPANRRDGHINILWSAVSRL
jgi:hypothetical protein